MIRTLGIWPAICVAGALAAADSLARVSTGDQDVTGQTMRLEQAGAIEVFTDLRSGKSMDRPGLVELLA